MRRHGLPGKCYVNQRRRAADTDEVVWLRPLRAILDLGV
jgi:hypothetical protein